MNIRDAYNIIDGMWHRYNERPAAWCQRTSARDARGIVVAFDSAAAKAWCLTGNLDRTAMEYGLVPGFYNGVARARDYVWNKLRENAAGCKLTVWNDHDDRTFAQVLALVSHTRDEILLEVSGGDPDMELLKGDDDASA